MKTLYLRIYLTVVAVLLLFALGSGWLVQRKLEQERTRLQSDSSQRLAAWASASDEVLLQVLLPEAEQHPVSFLVAADEAGIRHQLQMAADARLALAQDLGQFAHIGLAMGEDEQDAYSRRFRGGTQAGQQFVHGQHLYNYINISLCRSQQPRVVIPRKWRSVDKCTSCIRHDFAAY